MQKTHKNFITINLMEQNWVYDCFSTKQIT